MSWIMGLMGLGVAGLFGVSSVMDGMADNSDDIDKTAFSLGTIAVLGVGIYLLINYKKIK